MMALLLDSSFHHPPFGEVFNRRCLFANLMLFDAPPFGELVHTYQLEPAWIARFPIIVWMYSCVLHHWAAAARATPC
ncbi:MAG TPA: hypothetical protein VGE56_05645 [Rhodocyclaceae bacterium]|jgi:hypothetical protein